MVDIVTSLVEVKEWLGGSPSSGLDDRLQQLIDSVQAGFEVELGRTVLSGTQTMVVPRVRAFQRQLTLRHAPVTAITSVKYAADRDFASATAMASTSYSIDGATGVLYFDTDLTEGYRTTQVVYEGGMAANLAAFQAAYPDLHHAATEQVAWEYRRRKTPGANSESAQGANTTWTGELRLLKHVTDQLRRYTRRLRL